MGEGFSAVPEVQKTHLSHCLHIVLQNLICQPSMGVITSDWVERVVEVGAGS